MSRGNIFSLLIIGCLIIFFVIRQLFLVHNAKYTKGIIDKYGWGGRHEYVNYFFFVDGIKYHGALSVTFCLERNAETPCAIGDTVIVQYEKNHPTHNDLVHKLPNGEVITVD